MTKLKGLKKLQNYSNAFITKKFQEKTIIIKFLNIFTFELDFITKQL